MKKIVISVVLAASTLLAGCSYNNGTNVSSTQTSQFKEGVTTKSAIISALGTPQELRADGADQWLVYNYQEINSFGANKNESTTFVVGSDGVLKQVLKGKGQATNPLLQ
jgi:outer membrane protein assembly factor BamE (lipoprotein component of BamABCDE complex)